VDGPFATAFRNWSKVPVVFVLDLQTGSETLLALGWQPVIANGGETVVVADSEGHYRAVAVASGKAAAVPVSGTACPRLTASPSADVFLAWCRPTSDDPVAFTERNSPLIGARRMMTLKLVRLNHAEGQTVVSAIDPRAAVSFGVAR
jgi:hypothetical protein